MDFFLWKMLTVFVFIFFANIYVNEGYNTSSTCLPPPKCCKSYHSNQSNPTVCTGCLSGYFGQSCIFACRYPNYGQNCQSECLCDEEICNHITGCEQKTCPKGYFGPSCNSTCQFPSYGAGCRFNCSCDRQHCDSITGCATSVKNEMYWTTELPLNTSGINIMYVSYEHKTSKKGLLNNKSTWSKMNASHKAMLVSICIIGSIFFIFLLIIIVLNKKKNVVISYYRK